MKVIRKYQNRKLYDPSQSKYVNLKDIAQFVKNGESVVVVNHRQEDVTRDVLKGAVLGCVSFDKNALVNLILGGQL